MKLNLLLALLLVMGSFACKSRNEAPAPKAPAKDSTADVIPKPDFSGIDFASKMDLACGMLLSAGVQDTAHYNGKVYGFCSKECKTDFLKTPEVFLSSKYRH